MAPIKCSFFQLSEDSCGPEAPSSVADLLIPTTCGQVDVKGVWQPVSEFSAFL